MKTAKRTATTRGQIDPSAAPARAGRFCFAMSPNVLNQKPPNRQAPDCQTLSHLLRRGPAQNARRAHEEDQDQRREYVDIAELRPRKVLNPDHLGQIRRIRLPKELKEPDQDA